MSNFNFTATIIDEIVSPENVIQVYKVEITSGPILGNFTAYFGEDGVTATIKGVRTRRHEAKNLEALVRQVVQTANMI